MPLSEESRAFAEDFVRFLNDACTHYHAVHEAVNLLIAADFKQISEEDTAWNLDRAGKYFFVRNGTTLIAFTVGAAYESGNGFTVLGAHTDSPCLRIKPVATFERLGSLMLNTQPYGGGLWHTWFDRDLGLAGRIIYRDEGDKISSQLVRINRAIARIPNLAIHLTADRNKFEPNLQEHAQAILTMDTSAISSKLSEEDGVEVEGGTATKRFHPFLLKLIAEQAGIPATSILDMELQLIDIQPSTLGGGQDELLFSGRLDNLCSSYQSLRALIDGANEDTDAQENIRICALFDHEEVGSASTQGAGSSLFIDTLRRINDAGLTDGTHTTFMRTLRKSLVVSADMAHGCHPNYIAKHDPTLAPKINSGMVIKHNCNQRYATSSKSATLFREVARISGIPCQDFAIRSDGGCGSTIGPIIATLSGILTVDVGTPQFSMHSIREMMGSEDAYTGYRHLKAALKLHPSLARAMADV